MGSQRIASSLINRPYHPPGWGEPALGEEPGEGEDGYTNPPLEDGYSELSDGVIVDMQATLRELFDNPDLEMNQESFHLQSLGEAIEFNCSPGSGAEYEGGEGGEGGPGESEYIDPLCACEQSLYWANAAGYDCQTLNVIYFYHPDYLGSVEYITDMRGEPYQFFLNTPWGENLENQFAKNYTSFSSRFRFNGKEWDEETGNFYYGARYYDPKISVWLSVDAMASRGPWITPYNFSNNNPLVFVDPDGNWPDWFDNAVSSVSSAFSNAWSSITGVFQKASEDAADYWDLLPEVTVTADVKVDVGVQAGVKTPAGSAKINLSSIELFSGGVDLTKREGYVHNTILDEGAVLRQELSVSVKTPVKLPGDRSLSIGGAIGQVQRVTDNNGWLENGGYSSSDYQTYYNASLIVPIVKTNPQETGPFVYGAPAKVTAGSNFVGLDLSVGATFILGVNANLKVGYYEK